MAENVVVMGGVKMSYGRDYFCSAVIPSLSLPHDFLGSGKFPHFIDADYDSYYSTLRCSVTVLATGAAFTVAALLSHFYC